LKRIIIICNKQYKDYVSKIQDAYGYLELEAYGYEIEEGISEIPKINPGAVMLLNYYSDEEYKSGLVVEHLMRIRDCTNNQIILLSSTKPPTDFIMQASEYGVKTQWGKEIDFDLDNIPDTDMQTDEGRVAERAEDEDAQEESIGLEDHVEVKHEDQVPDEEDLNGGNRGEEIELIEEPEKIHNEIVVCIDDFIDLIPEPYDCADKFEFIPKYICETTKAVVITSYMISGSFATVKSVIKKIPKNIKLYAIDNYKLNQLIYGECEKEGMRFYQVDQIAQIFKDIEGKIIEEESQTLESSENEIDESKDERLAEKEVKRKFKFNFGSITEKISNVVEVTKNIPKPEIKIPKLQFRDTRPKDTSKKVEFVERNKILLIMSPMSTGKTEIASNLATGLAQEGFKTALFDLDTSKKGCFYNFPLFEKEHLFILRKIFLHLENEGLEDTIERYAYRSGNLYVYTSHRDVETEINKTVLKSFIRHLKASFDVVVVDVGKDLPKEIIENLMDTDGINKLLVTTQNIEHLNTIPYWYKWFGEFPLYYEDWVLLVNNYIKDSGVSDSDLELYFDDPDQGNELSFKINKKYFIPVSKEITLCKSKRSTVYEKDKELSDGIRQLIDAWKKGEM